MRGSIITARCARGWPRSSIAREKPPSRPAASPRPCSAAARRTYCSPACAPTHYEAARDLDDDVEYHRDARIVVVKRRETVKPETHICVVTAGTSDLPVAEEAAITAEVLGNIVDRVYDAGVAGLHRLLASAETMMRANALVVVAGMEGALPSVVGGLVDRPVIAVPTSVGYGANFGGLSALLTMLNSCASGISVVNIDNGFGAGYIASQINHTGFAAYKEEEK